MRGSRLDFSLPLLGFSYGTVFEPEAVIACFQDVAVVGETVEESCRHLGIAEHLWMPQLLTDESLRCGWLIRTIPYTASAFRSATDARDGEPG
jgi:hypothetical protein